MQANNFYFSGGPYQQILQGLHDSLATPEAFIKLMGPAHSGKSTLCDKLAQYMRRKGYRVVHFDYAIESPDMLRTMLARELDLPNLTNFARVLEDALADDNDKPLILIFDDAHLLTDISLIEVYRLAEVQAGTKRMLNIVLCGDTSLEQRLLSNSEFRSLLLQVSHKFFLEPMDPDTLNLFFVTYLEKSGMPSLQLEPTAMSYFYKSCKGYPEPAAAICRLMVEARLGKTELSPITKEELANLIKGASTDQNLPTSGFLDNNQLIVFGPVFAVLAIASLGFLYQQVNSSSDSAEANELIAAQTEAVFENDAEQSESSDAVTDIPVTAAVGNQSNQTVQAEIPVSTEEIDEIPISDSSLALVTAAERGVAAAEIVEPEYEALVEDSDPGQEVEVEGDQATEPRVLTLDEESDDSAIVFSPSIEDDEAVEEEPIDEVPAEDTSDTEIVAAAETLATAEVLDPESEQLDAAEDLEREALESELEEIPESVASVLEPESDTIEELEPANLVADIEESEIPEVIEESIQGAPDGEFDVVQSIQVSVEAWVSAWQSQSLPDYFSHYHDEFAPRYQDTQSAWRANRQRVIGNATWIRLEMSDFQLITEENGVYEVHFWLAYESPTYQDRTLKKLLVMLEDDSWKILEEINLVVET